MPLPPENLVSSEKETSVTSETAEVSTSEEKIKAEKAAPETDDTKAEASAADESKGEENA